MKLNIGGEQKKEGWKILNIQKKQNVDFVGDITDLRQFEDNSIEEIYASHVLEHIEHKKIITLGRRVKHIMYKGSPEYPNEYTYSKINYLTWDDLDMHADVAYHFATKYYKKRNPEEHFNAYHPNHTKFPGYDSDKITVVKNPAPVIN